MKREKRTRARARALVIIEYLPIFGSRALII